MGTKRVLVIEDDAAIRRGIVDALAFEGYTVLEADNGADGLRRGLAGDLDVVLLDLVLPGRDGFSILEELRRARPTLPVLILTAKGDEGDRVRGLRAGADDYVVKPFSVKELLARVQAVLRRSPERPTDLASIAVPGGVVDFAARQISFEDGGQTPLSEREVELLRYLAQNGCRAVSREEILSRVWRIEPTGVETRTIDMHIARLREKLRDAGAEPRTIVTVRGRGYRFAGERGEPCDERS